METLRKNKKHPSAIHPGSFLQCLMAVIVCSLTTKGASRHIELLYWLLAESNSFMRDVSRCSKDRAGRVSANCVVFYTGVNCGPV